MKKSSFAYLAFGLSILGTNAQLTGNVNTNAAATIQPPTPYRVMDIGANQMTWQRETYEPGPNGQVVTRIHKYTELASGMNYQNSQGEWVNSQDLIESYPSGAIARQGQYQVIFADNLNTAGAIDMQTADGKRLRSNILGLAYYDSSSGTNVLIGQIQDSQGEIIETNQILYTNAFAGLNADVRYTYRKGRFEQDVILRDQPPTPESLGLNPDTTEIEVITEFLNPPKASIVQRMMKDSTLPDEDVSWGAMRIGHGKAFDLGDSSNSRSKVKVRREYMMLQGRRVLIEGVPLAKIVPHLSQLPLHASVKSKLPKIASKTRLVPKTPLARMNSQPFKVASAQPSTNGFVLDYVQLNTAETNFTFQGDTTYYISDVYNLSGTTTFEGGTVIKMNYMGSLTFFSAGTIHCQTAPYHPAIFTSPNDDTVGEIISGSSGTPVPTDNNLFLDLGPKTVLHNMRFSYTTFAIGCFSYDVDIWDCQFANIENAVLAEDNNLGLHNVLMSEVLNDYPVYLFEANCLAEHVTCDGYGSLVFVDDPGVDIVALTNCLTTSGHYVTVDNGASNYVSGPIYQTVGAGSYYLATNSPYHNAGATNIDPDLLADLATKTTYPPIIYSNVTVAVATTFSPQAQRDNSGNPDLGYHYDPLDYCFSGVNASSNVTFTAGTAIGWFELPGLGGAGYGIGLMNGINAVFAGIATSPCVFARYSAVQESGNGLWQDKGWLGGIVNVDSYNPANPPILNAKFTLFSKPAGDSNHLRDGGGGEPLIVEATDCEFLNGFGGYNFLFGFTNCLFERAGIGNWTSEIYPYEMYRNCTFHGGSLSFGHSESGAPYWHSVITDCAFDQTTFSIDHPFGVNTNYAYYNYNAFTQVTNEPPTEGANTVVVTNFNWQSSWFGDYYLPPNSPLINTGSVTADLIGLYHFTTQTNQVKETNSVVDIGYHYVATDTNGVPIDTNGDGIPDYLEDANGDGVYDAGDLGPWNSVSGPGGVITFTNGLTLFIFEPKPVSNIP